MIKLKFIAPLFLLLLFVSSCATSQKYLELTDAKFKEIEAEMYKQDDWNPIRIEGYSKEELVAFYIKSYGDESISNWMEFAYKKMHRFEESKPTQEQEKEFKRLMELEHNRENTFYFMMHMTPEQIETVGY